MNLTDIARLRLFSQQLGVTTMNMAVDMVEWFAAVQGQEYAQAKWGLGLRFIPFWKPTHGDWVNPY